MATISKNIFNFFPKITKKLGFFVFATSKLPLFFTFQQSFWVLQKALTVLNPPVTIRFLQLNVYGQGKQKCANLKSEFQLSHTLSTHCKKRSRKKTQNFYSDNTPYFHYFENPINKNFGILKKNYNQQLAQTLSYPQV